MRLSILYALLDKTDIIGAEHLRAALAVWRYCQDLAAYLVGNRLGDPEAELALTAIRQAADGLTRDELRNNVFKRHMLAEMLDVVLERLLERGLVTKAMEHANEVPTNGGGRSVATESRSYATYENVVAPVTSRDSDDLNERMDGRHLDQDERN